MNVTREELAGLENQVWVIRRRDHTGKVRHLKSLDHEPSEKELEALGHGEYSIIVSKPHFQFWSNVSIEKEKIEMVEMKVVNPQIKCPWCEERFKGVAAMRTHALKAFDGKHPDSRVEVYEAVRKAGREFRRKKAEAEARQKETLQETARQALEKKKRLDLEKAETIPETDEVRDGYIWLSNLITKIDEIDERQIKSEAELESLRGDMNQELNSIATFTPDKNVYHFGKKLGDVHDTVNQHGDKIEALRSDSRNTVELVENLRENIGLILTQQEFLTNFIKEKFNEQLGIEEVPEVPDTEKKQKEAEELRKAGLMK